MTADATMGDQPTTDATLGDQPTGDATTADATTGDLPTGDLPTIRVAVVDDQPLARSGLRSIIDGEPDLTVVGDAPDGAAALPLVARTAPDVVVMDLRMPVMDGIEATRRIVAAQGRTQVLVLTTFDDDELVRDALAAGAAGFLLKDASPEQLLGAIRVVHGGHAILSPEVTRAVVSRSLSTRDGSGAASALGRLTGREREVVALVAHGLSNREIADRLVVGEGTVKTHVSNALGKTGCRSRVHLVALAYQSGMA
ncbi:MAG: response regulator transcription factor [Dermatophilaceae bacterium]